MVLEQFRDDVHVNLTVRLQRGGWFVVELKEVGGELPVAGALLDMENARNGSDYLDLLRRGMLGGIVAGDDDWRRASAHFLFEQAAGRYRLGPAEPGPYEVWVDRPGYRPIRRKLTILDPAEAIVDLRGVARLHADPPPDVGDGAWRVVGRPARAPGTHVPSRARSASGRAWTSGVP